MYKTVAILLSLVSLGFSQTMQLGDKTSISFKGTIASTVYAYVDEQENGIYYAEGLANTADAWHSEGFIFSNEIENTKFAFLKRESFLSQSDLKLARNLMAP